MSESSVSHFSSYKILFLLALLGEATTNGLDSKVDKMADSTNRTISEDTSVHSLELEIHHALKKIVFFRATPHLQWNCTVSSKQDFFPLKFDG
jgi:hypothetical protein